MGPVNRLPLSRIVHVLRAAFVAALSSASFAQSLSPSEVDPQSLRRPRLTWNQAEREFAFENWDRIFSARTIARGKQVHPLPDGAPLPTFSPGGEGTAQLVYGMGSAIPTIEDSAGWQLSEGCRVYKFGILTDPDCDILTGHGIAIQITRIRLLNLPPGQDDRATIGIELQADDDDRYFSSPFVGLVIAGRRYTPPEIDQALVFAKRDRPIFPEKLQPDQQRYQLPAGEKRFFRLRFSVSQSELGNGFALRVTGLHSEGEALQVPTVRFRWASSARAP